MKDTSILSSLERATGLFMASCGLFGLACGIYQLITNGAFYAHVFAISAAFIGLSGITRGDDGGLKS